MSLTYSLYGCPNTASTGIHWLLIHLAQTQGVSYEFCTIDIFEKKEQKEKSYLALNPKGRIPALVVHDGAGGEDVVVTEAGACAMVLADEHSGLRPASDAPLAARARYDEAFIFVVNSILPALRDWMYASKDGQETYAHGVRLLTLDRLKMMYGYLDGLLAKSKFLASTDAPTAVDFLFCATMSWDGFIYQLSRRFRNIRRFDDFMRSTDSFKELEKKENITISPIQDWEEPYVDLAAQL